MQLGAANPVDVADLALVRFLELVKYARWAIRFRLSAAVFVISHTCMLQNMKNWICIVLAINAEPSG